MTPFQSLFIVFSLVSRLSGSNSQNYFDMKEYVNVANSVYDWLVPRCDYNEDLVQSVNERLPNYIVAQDNAIKAISVALSSWEFDRKRGVFNPLVLVFSGPTGVGKSETAFEFASSVVSRHISHQSGRGYRPCGYLQFRGEELSPYSEYLRHGPAGARDIIRRGIVDLLKANDGACVIVFDEARKVASGVLDVLEPSLDKRGTISGPVISGSSRNPRSYSTANCIFIFIVDMTIETMARIMMKYELRDEIAHSEIRKAVKAFLDEEFERLRLGTAISDVIPFLPLEKEHIQQILQLKLRRLSNAKRNEWWRELYFEPSVESYVVEPPFISYENISSKDSSRWIELASAGGRALENAGPYKDLRSMLYTYMQPWKRDQILYVGITNNDDAIDKLRSSINRTEYIMNYDSAGHPVGIMFMQWCQPSDRVVNFINESIYSMQKSCLVIDRSLMESSTCISTLLFAEECELKWFGMFSSGGKTIN